MEKTCRKSTQKTLFFLLNPVLFNEQNNQKQNKPGTSDPVAIQVTKQVHTNSFV